MFSSIRTVAMMAAALALTACASLPRDQGYADTQELISARRDISPRADWADASADLPTTPINANDAMRLAFFNNPRIREEYARLGVGRAELEDARRISNPSFGYLRLSESGAGGRQVSRSLSLSLTDLLLLPARKRFAKDELDRLQNAVAGALLELASEVEIAWYESVSAHQVATMRGLVAQAADNSAELAQRFFDAGNITRLQLAKEVAASATARIDAVRAAADATRARSRLAGLIGLSNSADWRTQTQLPAPVFETMSASALRSLALENRLDLAAARQKVVLHEDALRLTQRWRWLGEIEVGVEREAEADSGVMRGPSLALELPLFNQGQGAVARAQAELLQAQAELDAQLLSVQNDAQLGLDLLGAMADIAERYRRVLVPQREMIVAESQKEVNFMLVGVFELLRAKQDEYDAYQEYLEAVRDYWIARAELRKAVGGRLPDDDAAGEPTIGVEVILPSQHTDMQGMDHSAHGAMDAPEDTITPTQIANPHAGHTMPAMTPDPHAGHQMNSPTKPANKDEPAAHDHHGDSL